MCCCKFRVMTLRRLIGIALAVGFSIASAVEWSHARNAWERGDYLLLAFISAAAVSLGWIAGEALDSEWP